MARMPLSIFMLAFLALAGCMSSESSSNSGGCSGGASGRKIGGPVAPVAEIQPKLKTPVTSYGGQKTCPVTGEALGSMGAAMFSLSVRGGSGIPFSENAKSRREQYREAV